MKNKRSTFNPHQKLMWNDSSNNLFESACLTESDLKHFCFGDGGDGAGDTASGPTDDPDPGSFGGEAEGFGAGHGGAAGVGAAGPGVGAADAEDAADENAYASHLGGMRSGMVGPGPLSGMADMTGFGTLSAQDLGTLVAEGFYPIGYQTGIGRGQLAAYASSDPAVAAADAAAGFGPAPDVGTFSFGDAVTDVMAMAPGPLGMVGTVVDTMTGPPASRGALCSAANVALGPATAFDVGQAISGLGQGIADIGEDVGEGEEGNKHGGMVGKKAGGLTSIKRAQSGGNIGGLSSIGPNLIDVINK